MTKPNSGENMLFRSRAAVLSAALVSVTALGILNAPSAGAVTVHWKTGGCDFYSTVPVHHYYSRDDQTITADGSWKCKTNHTFHMTSEINYIHPAFGRSSYEHKDYVWKNKKSGSWKLTHQCKFDYPNSGATLKTWQTIWVREAGSQLWQTPSVNLYCGIFK
ncbi:hypothetical protein [Streptomyces sp. HUAS TT20]|uniref:hypothetical protein n=1 Tax=Streptomyces sp. HUAS TT20 TaxID=3447509 RepID=UPI0021DB68F7|nr:hypothetical protein [Streptomyces sp. HUAS 15-9]UXY26373.1 hypothetical protein N8I87_07150 [Streptomyces sp. HUAS 15-9]